MNQSLSCEVAQLPSRVMRTMFGIPEFSFAQWLSLADAEYCGLGGLSRGSLLSDVYGFRDQSEWSPAAAYKRGETPYQFAYSYREHLTVMQALEN